MAAINPPIVTFSGGIFGKLLHNRVDVPQYPKGAEVYLNWWPLVQGPMTRRPSLQHIDLFDDSAVRGFQIPFVFSVDQSYNVLATNGTFKFYTQDGRIVIPVVTAAITGGTFATSATDYADSATITVSSTASGAAANLKDNSASTLWQADATATGWVQFDLTTARTLRFIWLTAGQTDNDKAPSYWTLAGSATGAFAGEETVVLTTTSDAGYLAGERRRFRITSPGSYRYYRLTMTSNGAVAPPPDPGGGSGDGGIGWDGGGAGQGGGL